MIELLLGFIAVYFLGHYVNTVMKQQLDAKKREIPKNMRYADKYTTTVHSKFQSFVANRADAGHKKVIIPEVKPQYKFHKVHTKFF